MVNLPPDMNQNPMTQFKKWYDEACNKKNINLPSAMCLSTVSKEGYPDSRFVLLKEFDPGFVFYTNYQSNKGKQLSNNPKAAITFYWNELGYQIRIQGRVSKIDFEDSDRYFQTRPREAQIGAWASKQSEILATREVLENRFKMFEEKFRDRKIPRPNHWGGYSLLPLKYEFWRQRDHRLHDRFQYRLLDEDWVIIRVYP